MWSSIYWRVYQPQYYWQLGLDNSIVRNFPVHCSILNRIPGLYPLNTSSPPTVTSKMSLDISQCALGNNVSHTPTENQHITRKWFDFFLFFKKKNGLGIWDGNLHKYEYSKWLNNQFYLLRVGSGDNYTYIKIILI